MLCVSETRLPKLRTLGSSTCLRLKASNCWPRDAARSAHSFDLVDCIPAKSDRFHPPGRPEPRCKA